MTEKTLSSIKDSFAHAKSVYDLLHENGFIPRVYYVYEKFGTILHTHEMVSEGFWVKLKEKSKEDFINMLSEGEKK